MKILRFLSIVAGRSIVVIAVFPLAVTFLVATAVVKALGAAWSDS